MSFSSVARRRLVSAWQNASRSDRATLPRTMPWFRRRPSRASDAATANFINEGEVLDTWRRTVAATAVLIFAFALTSCSNSDKSEAVPSTPKAAPTTPSPTSWETAYTPEQLSAYREALARLTAYEQTSEPIWEAGVVTPAAENLFKKYFSIWQAPLDDLEFYEKNKLTRTGSLTVLTSEATRIDLSEEGGSLTIRQCTDPSNITISQAGKEVAPENNGPQYREITLDRVANVWSVFRIDESEGDRPCAG